MKSSSRLIRAYLSSNPKWLVAKNLTALYGSNWAWFKPAAIKEARRNLLTYSEVLTGWTQTNSSVVDSATLGPHGTVAWKIIENTAASTSHFAQITPTALGIGAAFKVRVVAKAGTRSWIVIQNASNSTANRVSVNLSNGSIGFNQLTGVTVTDLGSGWYEIIAPFTNETANNIIRAYLAAANDTTSYTGNGTSYVLVERASVILTSEPDQSYQAVGSSWDATYTSKYPNETQYQDSTGSTAVTAAAQSVGFTSDYRGIELGPELATNGGFDSDTGWTKNAGWTISGGAANFSGSASGNNIYQSSSALAGRMYLITVQISSFSGTIGHSVRIGSVYSSTAHPSITSAGTYTYKLVAAENNAIIGVVGYTGSGTTTISVESISVREITNAYAIQATTANKPTYYTDARSVPVLRHDTTDVLTATLPAGFSGLGAELVTNGDFTNGLTSWANQDPARWTSSGGVATHVSGGTLGPYQNISMTVGDVYLVSVDITSISAGSLSISFGGTAITTPSLSTTGTHKYALTYTPGNGNLVVSSSSDFAGSIDNISLKRVSSLSSLYYANQWGVQQVHSLPIYSSYDLPGKPTANSDDVYEYLLLPSRPDTKTETEISKYLLKTMNGVVRRNLLTYTEDMSNAAWSSRLADATISHNIPDPFGGSKASRLTSIGAAPRISSASTQGAITGNVYTTSVWLRRNSGSGNIVLYDSNTISSTTLVTVSSSWSRVSVTVTASSTGSRFPGIYVDAGQTVDIYGWQFESGSAMTDYQRIDAGPGVPA